MISLTVNNLEIAVALGLPLNVVQDIFNQVPSIQYTDKLSALMHRNCQQEVRLSFFIISGIRNIAIARQYLLNKLYIFCA